MNVPNDDLDARASALLLAWRAGQGARLAAAYQRSNMKTFTELLDEYLDARATWGADDIVTAVARTALNDRMPVPDDHAARPAPALTPEQLEAAAGALAAWDRRTRCILCGWAKGHASACPNHPPT